MCFSVVLVPTGGADPAWDTEGARPHCERAESLGGALIANEIHCYVVRGCIAVARAIHSTV